MADAPFDVQMAHRWFAVELNNLAWDMLEVGSRTDEDNEKMVHAAHAACFHWLQAGTVLNHQRALCLLTTVYAALGYADAAVRHASKCLELSERTADDQGAFDLATAYGSAAQAYRCAGQMEKASELQAKALEAAATFDDPGDMEVFERLYMRA